LVEFNFGARRATLKVVYYGPALSGKTTNILRLHDRLPPDQRGDMVTLDTFQDRTLFFDLLPFFLTAPSGLRIKVKVYTVPGQVRYDATRKAVLSRADAVIFVADLCVSQQHNNAQSFSNLEENCRSLGMDLATLPLVVQFNKRDLPDIVSEGEICERWNRVGVPIFFASALNDVGVVETFEKVMRLCYAVCDAKLRLGEDHGLSEEKFLEELGITDA